MEMDPGSLKITYDILEPSDFHFRCIFEYISTQGDIIVSDVDHRSI